MQWAYVLENQGAEDTRCNQQLFLEINRLDLDDEHVFFDNSADRTELEKLIPLLSAGDELTIRSVEDLADSNTVLIGVLHRLEGAGVVLYSCEEPYLNGVEYHRIYQACISLCKRLERKQQQSAYRHAQRAGKVGRPSKQNAIVKALELYRTGALTMAQIEKTTGVSKSTIYRHLEIGGNQ